MELFIVMNKKTDFYISPPNSDSPQGLCLTEHFYSKGMQAWEAIYHSVISFMKQIFFSIPLTKRDLFRINTLVMSMLTGASQGLSKKFHLVHQLLYSLFLSSHHLNSLPNQKTFCNRVSYYMAASDSYNSSNKNRSFSKACYVPKSSAWLK